MSHTYASRPAVTRTGGGRGRGRGRGTKTQNQNTTSGMQGPGHSLGGVGSRSGASGGTYPAGASNDLQHDMGGEAGAGSRGAGQQDRIQRFVMITENRRSAVIARGLP